MAAENRLTADQLAALTPGDAVTIESVGEFGRRRHASGTVARVEGQHLLVSVRGPHGGRTYLERFRLRDGVRIGGLGHAELVDLNAAESDRAARRRTQHIDALYREWARNRADVDRLRRLHAAIGECLDGGADTQETAGLSVSS